MLKLKVAAMALLIFAAFASICGAFEKVFAQWGPVHCDTGPVSKMNLLLFNKSYQNANKNTSVSFKTNSTRITTARVLITAHFSGDDKNEEAVVRLEIDGAGGYVGCERISEGQFRGNGVLKKGETKTWTYDLSKLQIAYDNKNGSNVVNLLPKLNSKTDHTMSCWVSGGKNSWVTVRLIALGR